MEKTVFIISEIDALIETGLQKEQVFAGIPLKTSLSEKSKITYYPINSPRSKFLPFCFEYSQKESEHYTKYKLKDAEVIKIHPMRVPKYSFVFEEEIDGKKYSLSSGFPSFFTVLENEKVLYSKKIDSNLKEPSIKKKASCVIMSAKWNDQIYFLILNGKTEVFTGFVSEYKYEQDFLSVVNWQKDMAKQGFLYKINLKNGIVSKSLIYSQPPKLIKNPKLISYAFFEAVKTKNYKLARKYLSNALNIKIADEHFTAYFGKFSDVMQNFYLPSPAPSVALVYNLPQPEIKVFELKLDEDKISNISELN